MKRKDRSELRLEAEALLGAEMREIKGASGCGGKVDLKPLLPSKPIRIQAEEEDEETWLGGKGVMCAACKKGSCLTAT